MCVFRCAKVKALNDVCAKHLVRHETVAQRGSPVLPSRAANSLFPRSVDRGPCVALPVKLSRTYMKYHLQDDTHLLFVHDCSPVEERRAVRPASSAHLTAVCSAFRCLFLCYNAYHVVVLFLTRLRDGAQSCPPFRRVDLA